MHIPTATYRIQFNRDFTFNDFIGIIDYLHQLGVSTVYAAPILKSIKGSKHGYDVIDPHVIDPEIGTIEELRTIAAMLRRKGMTWLQDIVPNHMAFDSSNLRLMDVLERGPLSNYYQYFDINWNHPSAALKGKLLVPFLGDSLEDCVRNKQVRLNFSQAGFVIEYFTQRYPVSIGAYEQLFSDSDSRDVGKLKHEWEQFWNGAAPKAELKTWQRLKSQWFNSISRSEENSIRSIIEDYDTHVEKLFKLLDSQHYVLGHWKKTDAEINYRRFFTVNQLICLRMEDAQVFREYHSFLYSLYTEDVIQGFRIDHIDGLFDPTHYIRRLRDLFGDTCYIIAEKILEAKEVMPPNWSLQGTSGYEFLAYVSQLFTDRKGAGQLVKFYKGLVPQLPAYRELVVENKILMLENYMGGEWDYLVEYFCQLGLHADFKPRAIKQVLGALMVSLPVYRIYPEGLPLTGSDLVIMSEAFQKAKQLIPAYTAALDHVHGLLVSPVEYQKANILTFLKRLMQFTGPLTAKGVEDTTFYIYNPLISHDEVGDSPSTLGITTREFHARMVLRQQTTPLSLNATATHDTKRGEDVRIRLNVLSEIPESWITTVQRWFEMNKSWTLSLDEVRAPTVNDEYFIYQSIVGGFPEDFKISENWETRLREYLIKVVREAKVNSSWEAPNEAYENGCTEFIKNILKEDSAFLQSAVQFIKKLVGYASTNALGQVLIKITAPGIPDVYQGCELWDLSYVDPDNRRPVDYSIRQKYLMQIELKEKEGFAALRSFLANHRELGLEKLFVTWKVLNLRRMHKELFNIGEYVALPVSPGEAVACAYARHYRNAWMLIIVPLAVAKEKEWTQESVLIPANLTGTWINQFTHKQIAVGENLFLRDVMDEFPLCLLTKTHN